MARERERLERVNVMMMRRRMAGKIQTGGKDRLMDRKRWRDVEKNWKEKQREWVDG